MFYAYKENKEIKNRLTAIEEGIASIKKSTTKMLQLGKEICTDIGKV